MKCHYFLILYSVFFFLFQPYPASGQVNSTPWLFFQPQKPARSIQVMAHRGAAWAAPANTLPAISLAAEMGFEWVEVDVRLTQDGHHVLIHNETVDETCNGKGYVNQLTLEQIQQLDAGSRFAPRFAGTKIPTLSQVLSFCKEKINLYLDCKAVAPALLVEEITRHQMEDQVAVYGSLDTLRAVHKLARGKIPLMAKCFDVDHLEQLIKEIQVAVIEVNFQDLSHEFVHAAHQAGVLVQVKVLGENDRQHAWQKALRLGVDFLQTDHPERVQACIHHGKAERPVCWLAAHRGLSALAPENTLPAIDQAIALRCDFVEIDVRTTADGRMVLMHNSTLDKTTDLQGELKHLSFDTIRLADAGSWFSPHFAHQPVPTLAQVLERCKGKIKIYLDNKDTQPGQLVLELERYGMIDDVVVYDGDMAQLEALRKLNPNLKRMPPLRRIENLPTLIKRIEPYAVDVPWESLSPQLIETSHRHDIKVFSDAMGGHETIKDYLQAIRWGIDTIQTDNPLMVQRALERVVD